MSELKFYTFTQWEEELKSVCSRYPSFLRLFPVGKSHDERNIYEVRLGNCKPCVICAGGIHGREWVNPVLLLHMIEEYAKAAKEGTLLQGLKLSEILETCSFCFVPMVNPDGYVIATEGFDKIKHPYLRYTSKLQNTQDSDWKKNARGEDINRNFPGKSWYSGNGPWPASELETRALIQVFCSHPDSLCFLDFHSRGRLLYYYRKGMGYFYNKRARKLAATLAKACGYRTGKPSEEFLSKKDGGNSVHYYAEYFHRPAITVETIDEREGFPLKEELLAKAYEEVRLLPLLCAKA